MNGKKKLLRIIEKATKKYIYGFLVYCGVFAVHINLSFVIKISRMAECDLDGDPTFKPLIIFQINKDSFFAFAIFWISE
jgi:hypothetical protein